GSDRRLAFNVAKTVTEPLAVASGCQHSTWPKPLQSRLPFPADASIQRGQNRYRAACRSQRMRASTCAEVLMVEVHLDRTRLQTSRKEQILEYGSRRVVTHWIPNDPS